MLTKRQQEFYDYLRAEHRRTGIIPTTREIQQHFGFSSQTAAISHLRALERKGVIQREAGKARAVRFTDEIERPERLDIPLLGRIAAGMAQETEEEVERFLSVDLQSFPLARHAKAFALQVRGDSMIDAHIVDGDYVILERREPRNRDIVAALIDGETSLKRYILEGRHPYLKAENPAYPDLIPARELLVQGVMVGLIRSTPRWR